MIRSISPDNQTIYLYSDYYCKKSRLDTPGLFWKGSPIVIDYPCDFNNWICEIGNKYWSLVSGREAWLALELQKVNGSFCAILQNGNEIVIISDLLRSNPIFYGYRNNLLFITDNLEKFQFEKGRFEIDADKVEEFIVAGLIFGNQTIYEEVFCIQAGEILSIDGLQVKSHRYFEYKPRKKSLLPQSRDQIAKEIDDHLIRVFSRIIEQTPKVNRWIVPLSGGHDSRIVVNYLYRLGQKNVICFSYGNLENEQAKISQLVAEKLGYSWYFSEYTEQKWKVLHEHGLFDAYIDFAFNGVSLPHFQDFLAVYELKKKGVLQNDDIFVPGHTAVGSIINEKTNNLETKQEAIQFVYQQIRQIPSLHSETSPIIVALNEMYDKYQLNPGDLMAFCDWQERQSKYISYSYKVYEFFGFESRQPLWDREFVEFWLRIPTEGRVEGREPLYDTEKRGGLVDNLKEIPYAHDLKHSHRRALSHVLKKLIPSNLLVGLLRFTKSRINSQLGLENVFSLRAHSVKELLKPIEDFPKQTLPYLRRYSNRFPYQMNICILTTFYTLRRLLSGKKNSTNDQMEGK